MKPFKNLILADDDNDDIEVFQHAVKELCPSIEVTSVGDGEKLMKLLEKVATPDAIVLDLNMPGLHGYQCLKAIREQNRFDDVVIIIYSTSSRRKDIDYCLELGANHYVIKPTHIKGVHAFIAELCTGKIDKAELWKTA